MCRSIDVLTLRIKKVYFDKIIRGEKTIEYRDRKAYYERLFESRRYKYLKLHYQGSETLTIELRSIRLIDRPDIFKNSTILKSNKIYALYLGRLKKVN